MGGGERERETGVDKIVEINLRGKRRTANETLNSTSVREWGGKKEAKVCGLEKCFPNKPAFTFLMSHSANGPPLHIKGEKESSITAKACIVLLPHIL